MDQTKQQRQAQIGCQHQRQIVAMLKHDHRVVLQIPHIAVITILFPLILPQHPADMGVPEATPRAVGILVVVIHMTMMAAMIRRPVQRRVLQRQRTADGKQPLQRRMSLVSLVRPEAVITRRDREPAQTEQQQERSPLPEIVTLAHPIPRHGNQRHQSGEREQQGIGENNRGSSHLLASFQRTAVSHFPWRLRQGQW